MKPAKGWTQENVEIYARFLAENYYIDEERNRQPRRSDADAYEEWKFCAAKLGVSRSASLDVPDEVEERAAAIRSEMEAAEALSAAAPAMRHDIDKLRRALFLSLRYIGPLGRIR